VHQTPEAIAFFAFAQSLLLQGQVTASLPLDT